MQVQSDLEQGIVGAVPIPPDDAGKEEVIAALVANVEAMIKADRKITALKQLQVRKMEWEKYDHCEADPWSQLTFLHAGSYLANWISE